MTKAQLAVTLYMQTQVLTGFIYRSKEERLSDILNGLSLRRENRGRFLALSDVTIGYADGIQERDIAVITARLYLRLETN